MNEHGQRLVSLMLLWLALLISPIGGLEAAEPNTDFFETVDVNVVNVEVYVFDKKGNPVHGLTADDFEILEDGKPVKITNFYAAREGLPTDPAEAITDPSEPGNRVRAPEDQRLNLVIFIDNLNLNPRSRNYVIEALKGSLFFNLNPDDQVMLVSYDGSLNIRQGLTGDPNDLVNSLEELAAGSPRGVHAALDRVAILRELQQVDLEQDETTDFGAQQSLDVTVTLADELLSSIRSYAQRRYREMEATSTILSGFISALSGLQGRKALIYVSDGLSIRPGEGLYYAWESKFRNNSSQIPGFVSAESEARDTDATAIFEALGKQANANQVTYHTILASGGQNQTLTPAERGAFFSLDSPSDLGQVWTDRLESIEKANFRGSMQILAESTGGLATLSTDGIGKALKRMKRDLDNYYSLGYSTPGESDNNDHRIRVRVKEKSLKVRHREGYRSKSPDEKMTDLTRTALLFDTDNNPLQVAVGFGEEKKDKKGRYEVPIMVKFPLSSVLLLPQEHYHEGRVSIYVGARDAKGGTSPIQKMPAPIRIPNDKLLTALGQVAGFRVTLLMKPGEHSVVVGVRDELANVESTTRISHTPGQ